MTEFKQGDRVRYNGKSTRFANTSKVGETGVVVGVEPGGDVRVKWDDSGLSATHYVDNLEIIDDQPKVGDRVRFVHEGVVTGTSGRDSGLALLIDGTAHLVNKGGTVEVLERAPKAKTDYAKGTELIVTGDTASWFHSFKSGTRVTVLSGGRGEQGGSYRRGTFGYSVKDAVGNVWDVEERDLEVAPPKAYPPGTVVRGRMFTWIVTDKGSVALDTATGRVALTECSVTGTQLAKAQAEGAQYEVIYEPASA